MYPYTRIPVYPYIHIPVYPYTRIPVYPYIRISVYPYTRIPVYPYTRISVYPYTRIPVYPYTRISVYPYTRTRIPGTRVFYHAIACHLSLPCRYMFHIPCPFQSAHFNHYRLKNLTIPLNYARNCLYSLICMMRNVCLNISRPRRKTIGKIIFAPKALLKNGNSMSFVFHHELSVVNNERINNLLCTI